MPLVSATVECPVFASFRVAQVAGMFDLAPADRCRETFAVEVPGLDEPWQIGVIVGPSGSGKTTIARQAFGEALCSAAEWPTDRAVVDCLGELPIKQLTRAFTAVGFGSPPSWVKPYHVLSNGEKFRCDLARALLSRRPLVAFDEFSSVVDRAAAKIGAAAVANALHAGRFPRRFVAVTCHYDVVEWLQPDWVLDMATLSLARGRLRRPPLRLEIVRCRRAAWRLFARHHYLSAELNRAAECYLGTLDGEPAAFGAFLATIGRAGMRRVTRMVVLPDFQGIGVGGRFLDTVCEWVREQDRRVTITTSHPSMIAHLAHSRAWRIGRVSPAGRRRSRLTGRANYRTSAGRPVVSAEFHAGAYPTARRQASGGR
ncbi:MAG TPA: GNAT family N-acetyltransferase [Pirellulales bacterium]|nr:GNAT family N-acetyltransferase [Pirellulales bacterium]